MLPYAQMCDGDVVVKNEDCVSAGFTVRPVASSDLAESCASFSTVATVRWKCRCVDWGARPWVGVFEKSATEPAQALARQDAALCRTSHVSGIARFDLSEYANGDYAFCVFAHATDRKPAVSKKFRLPP